MTQPPAIRLGRYRHFKGGEYQVLGLARDSETLAWQVVYRALYAEGGLWVRPAAMFSEQVEREGRTMPRFDFLGEMPAEVPR
jgi:cyclomaltodextrinase